MIIRDHIRNFTEISLKNEELKKFVTNELKIIKNDIKTSFLDQKKNYDTFVQESKFMVKYINKKNKKIL